MNDKELKHMGRADLIEIIYQYRRRTDDLTAEVARLTGLLQDRQIRIDNAGSIAEAALSVNKIFEAAQQAAEQYLDSIRLSDNGLDEQSKAIIEEAKRKATEIENEGRKKHDELISDAEKKASEMIGAAQAKCDDMNKLVVDLILNKSGDTSKRRKEKGNEK